MPDSDTTTETATREVTMPARRGAGAPQFNGAKGMRPPWPKGVSGNPLGRPSDKPLTQAFNDILKLMAQGRAKDFKPSTEAERLAWSMIRKAWDVLRLMGV
jgi:hypothetical protein